jgi:hypothetical protein
LSRLFRWISGAELTRRVGPASLAIMVSDAEWMSFEDAVAYLMIPVDEVAGHILAGDLGFRVRMAVARAAVLPPDVQVRAADVRTLHARRWSPATAARAADRVNRAALKFGLHPTRTSPGVRGKTKRR